MLLAHVGDGAPMLTAARIRDVAAALPRQTLVEIVADGPYMTQPDHWAKLSPAVRASWLVEWLERELEAERRASEATQWIHAPEQIRSVSHPKNNMLCFCVTPTERKEISRG
ncbi:MAG TPA: hypothetical protein VIW19_11085 [Gaiellaceae bacterium]